MFENVIGQERLVSLLADDLESGTIPNALLLEGPRYSAKATIALEAGRVLTCLDGTGDWTCECASCRAHREMAYPELISLGPRDFVAELTVAAEALRREHKRARVYLFVRAARRLLHRFDTRFRSGKPDAGIDRLVERVNESSETLIEAADAGKLQPEIESIVATCESEARSLAAKLPFDLYPVAMIRNVSAWTRTAGIHGTKVVILEEIHTMQDSAQNALLKVLEEPPEGTFFLLTSSRPSAIKATVLSRLRRYSAIRRTRAAEAGVLKRVFSRADFDGRLEDLFRTAALSGVETYGEFTSELSKAIVGEPFDGDHLADLFAVIADGSNARTVFPAAIGDAVRFIDLVSRTGSDRERIYRRWESARRHVDRVTARNLGATATLRAFLAAWEDAS